MSSFHPFIYNLLTHIQKYGRANEQTPSTWKAGYTDYNANEQADPSAPNGEVSEKMEVDEKPSVPVLANGDEEVKEEKKRKKHEGETADEKAERKKRKKEEKKVKKEKKASKKSKDAKDESDDDSD